MEQDTSLRLNSIEKRLFWLSRKKQKCLLLDRFLMRRVLKHWCKSGLNLTIITGIPEEPEKWAD